MHLPTKNLAQYMISMCCAKAIIIHPAKYGTPPRIIVVFLPSISALIAESGAPTRSPNKLRDAIHDPWSLVTGI